MQACVFRALSFAWVAAIALSSENVPEEAPKYAYVTMFLNPSKLPDITRRENLISEAQVRQELKSMEAWMKSRSTLEHVPMALTKRYLLPYDRVLAEVEAPEEMQRHDAPVPKEANVSDDAKKMGYERVIDMAMDLTRLKAKYPLIVLTNDEDLIEALAEEDNPKIIVQEVKPYELLSRSCKTLPETSVAFQKLQVFKMTDYQKMLWVDADVKINKNLDSLFDLDLRGGNLVYGQHEGWKCEEQPKSKSGSTGGFCSGMMLFQPSLETFDGIMQKQSEMEICWGDQDIISAYFKKDRTAQLPPQTNSNFMASAEPAKQLAQREVRFFPNKIVSFAHCPRKTTPAAVHFGAAPQATAHQDVIFGDKDL